LVCTVIEQILRRKPMIEQELTLGAWELDAYAKERATLDSQETEEREEEAMREAREWCEGRRGEWES
jgi:hypothetical protein